MILGHFLNSDDIKDHEKFLLLISEWPSKLYSTNNIITALTERIKKSSDDYLMDALAKL